MTKTDHKARGQLAHANMLRSQADAAAAGAQGDAAGQLLHNIAAGGHQATRDHHLPASRKWSARSMVITVIWSFMNRSLFISSCTTTLYLFLLYLSFCLNDKKPKIHLFALY
ncbi:hypothetical protein FRC20_008120 [Serendipita sp. 405]|nr:hypothetical protein FRC20_008120 [Serendipita sp. 405]